VSCNTLNFGCNGGNLQFAWRYFVNTGVRTEKCIPYTSQTGEEEACPKDGECSPTGKELFPDEKATVYKALDYNTIMQNPNKAKQELVDNGPLELAFTVYQDFMTYKSGIYYHVTGSKLGGHAVKLVGYGVENGLEYWLCANSWGPKWGDKGYFKIKIGDSDSSNDIVAGPPAYNP